MPQRITKIHLLAAVVSVASLALFAAASVVVGAQSKPSDGPRYTNGTELMFPDNYREWTFLSSGLSMTYEKESDGADLELRRFQNVFVNPSSYRYFKEHGTGPTGRSSSWRSGPQPPRHQSIKPGDSRPTSWRSRRRSKTRAFQTDGRSSISDAPARCPSGLRRCQAMRSPDVSSVTPSTPPSSALSSSST